MKSKNLKLLTIYALICTIMVGVFALVFTIPNTSALMYKKQNNATPVIISADRLGGTTWQFNVSGLDLENNAEYDVNFTSNSTSYTKLKIDATNSKIQFYNTTNGYVDVFTSNAWSNEAYRTVAITTKIDSVVNGSSVASGTALYNYLLANAQKN